MADDEFEKAKGSVAKNAQRALRLDADGRAPHKARGSQDKAAEVALSWIAEHSACPRSRELAQLALQPIHSDGVLWFA